MLLFEKQSFINIQKTIASLRESKGKEKEALSLIDKALEFGQGVVVNLMWERALIYQHMIMQGNKKALPKMEAAVLSTGKYIKANGLREWESRYYRFLGRVNDYKNNFSESVRDYEKAIPLAKLDPEFLEKGYPRWLEIEGFLSYALIMSGKTKEGIVLARNTFKKYDHSSEGKGLKKEDYFTWAVWKSGVAIRTIGALQAKKVNFDKKEFLSRLKEAENDLNPPKNVKIWGNFTLRKDEIALVKKNLKLN